MLIRVDNTFTRQNKLTPPPESIPNHDISLIIDTIEKKQFLEFTKFLKKYPHLLNYPLNSDKQTPLIISIQHEAWLITDHLLDQGADSSYQDENKLVAMDYANFKQAQDIVDKINLQTTLAPIFTTLAARITSLMVEPRVNNLQINILKLIRVYANNFVLEAASNHPFARQIDLYYTASGLVNAVASAQSDKELLDKLKVFFALRAHALRGDEHDYFYNDTLANKLCVALVKLIAPPDLAPLNNLLSEAITVDRKKPWTSSLGDQLVNRHDFFRSREDEIHCYSTILAKAKAILEFGETKPERIWLCLDEKNISPEMVGRSIYKPLAASDLEVIKQRSKTFKKMIERTEALNNYTKSTQSNVLSGPDSIIFQLNQLRHSLLLGDKSEEAARLLKQLSLNPEEYKAYRGTEEFAGSLAHMGVYTFWRWWQQLGTPYENANENNTGFRESELQRSIRKVSAIHNGREISLNDIFCMLWVSPDKEFTFNTHLRTLCAEINGQRLETILKDDAAKATLLALCNEEQWLISQSELGTFEAQIEADLELPVADEFNLPGIFKAITPFISPMSETTLAALDYNFFDRLDPEIFSKACSSNDLTFLENLRPDSLPIFFKILFEHPELITINPKLSLYTAILFQNNDEPGNAFFNTLKNHLRTKEFVAAAQNIMEMAFKYQMPRLINLLLALGFHATEEFAKKFVGLGALSENYSIAKQVLMVCDNVVLDSIFSGTATSGHWELISTFSSDINATKIPENILSQLLIHTATQKNWPLMWEYLDILIPKNPAVIDKLTHLIVAADELVVISNWRHRAGAINKDGQPNYLRQGLIRFWQHGINQPNVLTENSKRLFSHLNFPEVEDVLLSANTKEGWKNVAAYVKEFMWGHFSDVFVDKLLQRALIFNARIAAEIMVALTPLFEIHSAPKHKPLIQNLLKYCKKRLEENHESNFHRYSLWGRWRGMSSSIKLAAAVKAVLATRVNNIIFTPLEQTALSNSRLGWIMYRTKPPQSLRQALRR